MTSASWYMRSLWELADGSSAAEMEYAAAGPNALALSSSMRPLSRRIARRGLRRTSPSYFSATWRFSRAFMRSLASFTHAAPSSMLAPACGPPTSRSPWLDSSSR